MLKGWAVFEYEGVGRVTMKAGSCFYQPPRIRHREIRHSKDLEMIEIVAPANFRTYSALGETCSQKVTGPSFTRLTCMSAPKRPVATRLLFFDVLDELVEQPLARPSGERPLEKLGPRAAVRIGGQRELRHGEQSRRRCPSARGSSCPAASGKMR